MFFFRFEEVRYANIGIKVNELKYVLVKETPKGYWIKPTWDINEDHKKWVSKTSKRRYAYPTKEEAMINFRARKKRQIQILTAKIQNARLALLVSCVEREN
jgi:hypothetical protein